MTELNSSSNKNKIVPEVMVSIVMVAYNQEKVIAEAIRGVIKQKVDFPIELIISDDCSTDSTYQIICDWANRYPDKIRPLRNNHNIGIQANYLKALAECKGKYLAMCDGDDYWISSKKLSRQVEFLENNPLYSISFHRMINYYADTHTMSLSNGRQKTDCSILDLARGNFITNASVMYRVGNTDLTNLPEFLKDNTLPDYGLHMLFASQGLIHYFSKPMAVYRKLSVAAWSSQDDCKALKMAYNVRKSLISYFKNDIEVTTLLVKAAKQILSKMYQISNIGSENQQFAINEWNTFPTDTTNNIAEFYHTAKRKRLKQITLTIRNIITRIIPRPKP